MTSIGRRPLYAVIGSALLLIGLGIGFGLSGGKPDGGLGDPDASASEFAALDAISLSENESGTEASVTGPGFEVPYPPSFDPIDAAGGYPLRELASLTGVDGAVVGLDARNWIAAYPFPFAGDGSELERARLEQYGNRLVQLFRIGALEEFGKDVLPSARLRAINGSPGVELSAVYPAAAGSTRWLRVTQAFSDGSGLVIAAGYEPGASQPIVRRAYEQAIAGARLEPR
jgi:hypothetical protein